MFKSSIPFERNRRKWACSVAFSFDLKLIGILFFLIWGCTLTCYSYCTQPSPTHTLCIIYFPTLYLLTFLDFLTRNQPIPNIQLLFTITSIYIFLIRLWVSIRFERYMILQEIVQQNRPDEGILGFDLLVRC